MRRRLMAFAATVMVAAAGFTVALLLSGGGAAAPIDKTTSVIDKTTSVIDKTTTLNDKTTTYKTTTYKTTIKKTIPVTIGFQCRLVDPQPRDPLELNMVAVGNFAKTIAMEKEVAFCESSQRRQIRDMETFIETVEQAGDFPFGARVVSKRVETALCIKDLTEGSVECSTRSVPIGSALATPLKNCHPSDDQPADPVEMKTVVFGTSDALEFRLVKTVKVEKEIFHCIDSPSGTVAELYLFTEILEKARFVNGTAVDIAPVAKGFEGIICYKIPILGVPPTKCNFVRT